MELLSSDRQTQSDAYEPTVQYTQVGSKNMTQRSQTKFNEFKKKKKHVCLVASLHKTKTKYFV